MFCECQWMNGLKSLNSSQQPQNYHSSDKTKPAMTHGYFNSFVRVFFRRFASIWCAMVPRTNKTSEKFHSYKTVLAIWHFVSWALPTRFMHHRHFSLVFFFSVFAYFCDKLAMHFHLSICYFRRDSCDHTNKQTTTAFQRRNQLQQKKVDSISRKSRLIIFVWFAFNQVSRHLAADSFVCKLLLIVFSWLSPMIIL